MTTTETTTTPAIPLSGPDGVVRAWACPRCYRVDMSVSCGGGAIGRLREAEHSREAAESCGVCRGCGAVLSCDTHRLRCPSCLALEAAADAARLLADEPRRIAAGLRRERALAESLDQASAIALRDLMRSISEEYWSAGWISGLESTLWQMLTGELQSRLAPAELVHLRTLATLAGGWWCYASDDGGGEIFITTDAWLTHLAERRTA